MAIALPRFVRIPAGVDYRAPSPHRKAGLLIAGFGVLVASVVLVAGIAAGNLTQDGDATGAAQVLSWSFGLNAVALSTIKVGIAVILIGVLVRLFFRAQSIRAALPALKSPAPQDQPVPSGTVITPYGKVTITSGPPQPLLIHRMAQALWAPMLVMGAMAVLAGFVLSLVQAGNVATEPALATSQSSWVQGLLFLGEAMILAGISFLLGSILAGIRSAGGQVQAELGLPVKTLEMPTTAKIFIGLMMVGMLVAIFQFIAYIVVAQQSDPVTVAANFAWLGLLREVGLGLLLSGVVLALATIATALGLQFTRIVEIIKTGR